MEHAVRFSYNRNAWVTFDDNTLRTRFAVANVLAWPLGFYLLDRWLDHFVYHIDLHVGYFLLAGGGAVLIAFVTVALQAIPAARTNPITALRHE